MDICDYKNYKRLNFIASRSKWVMRLLIFIEIFFSEYKTNCDWYYEISSSIIDKFTSRIWRILLKYSVY
jgi:hypothetical protein